MAVKVSGMAELQAAFANFVFDVEEATSVAVNQTAIAVRNEAIRSIRDPSVGTHVTRYTVSGNPYPHVASKPGDAPNTDTGQLINAVEIKFKKGDDTAHVFTRLDYGFFLETVHDRPWLEPAKVAEVMNFERRVKTAIEAQIKKAGK